MARQTAKPMAAKKWATTTPRENIHQRYFPDMVLTTHEGKKVRLYEDLIKDKIVLINFMYAHCTGICLPVTSNLIKVQQFLGKRVGQDIFIYSFTLKPLEDTPEVLRNYAEAHGVGPGWTFLTGDPVDLERLRRNLGFTDPDPARDADKTNHTGMVRYGNEALQLWAAFPGMSQPESIAKSILWVDWPPNGPRHGAPAASPIKKNDRG
jgi:protein SCO1/2